MRGVLQLRLVLWWRVQIQMMQQAQANIPAAAPPYPPYPPYAQYPPSEPPKPAGGMFGRYAKPSGDSQPAVHAHAGGQP